MITVVYPPGGSDPIHRHNAHAFVYVLEGSVVMQLKGGKEVTLTPGQTFYEGPNDIHIVGRNASTTKPAKLLVFLVKNKDYLAGYRIVEGNFAGVVIYSFESRHYETFTNSGNAPVWLNDSRRLLFNDHGRLYLLEVSSG